MKMLAMFVLLVSMACDLKFVSGQTGQTGQTCENTYSVTKNFNFFQFQGTWYDYARSNGTFDSDGKCTLSRYRQLYGVATLKIVSDDVEISTGRRRIISGRLYATDPRQPAKLMVRLSNGDPIPYWILNTDYKCYSVIMSCSGDLELRVDIWILTRERIPSEECLEKAFQAVDDQNLGYLNLRDPARITDQTDCPN